MNEPQENLVDGKPTSGSGNNPSLDLFCFFFVSRQKRKSLQPNIKTKSKNFVARQNLPQYQNQHQIPISKNKVRIINFLSKSTQPEEEKYKDKTDAMIQLSSVETPTSILENNRVHCLSLNHNRKPSTLSPPLLIPIFRNALF